MLIGGGAGLGANVELLIEPSATANVEMLIATGYEISENVEIWAILRDFT